MEFRFDANQEFQVKAVEAACDLFDGQTRRRAVVRFKAGTLSLAAIANSLDLEENELLSNLKAVQERNGIRPDERLECIEEPIKILAN